MDSTIRYVGKVSILKTIMGIAIACISLYSFVFVSYFGIVLMAISLRLLQTEGSEIDLASKKYRKFFSVLGMNFGKWKKLPEIEYVSVFLTEENISLWVSSASTNVVNEIYKINLFYDSNKKIEAFTSYDKDEAFKIGHHIAEALITDLLDATNKGDFEYVDKEHYRETGEIKHTY